MRYVPLLCAMLILVRPSFAPAADVAPPEPEQYVDDGHYLQYVQVAEQFLRDQPDSAAAARVAMDLLAAATVFDDQATAAKMRILILCGHPTSVQAKYLVATLPDAAGFAGLMGQAATENFQSPPAGFALRYDQALHLGFARFGAAALGNGGGLVCTFLLAGAAGDADAQKAAVQILNAGGAADQDWRQILVLVADNSSTPLSRLTRLHALSNRAASAPFEGYLINQLQEADRQSTAVIQIQAEDCLYAGRMDDALPFLDKLGSAADEPRWLFWRAWAQASTGNTQAALDLFAKLTRDHPDDPWAREAADLTPAINSLDADLSHNVEAALSVSRRLSSGVDLLEGHATFPVRGGPTVDIYVDFQSEKLFQLLLQRDGATAMAYRATDEDALFYFQGLSSIARFAKPAIVPLPRIQVARQGSGFVIGEDVKFAASLDALREDLTDLMSGDTLSSREGLEDVLRFLSRQGALPLPPASPDNTDTIYQWVIPDVASPTVRRLVVTVTSDGAISGLQTDTLSIASLRYGLAGAFTLSPPSFPDLPKVDRGPMDVNVLQQALPAIVSLFIPPPPATQPAAKP